MSTLDEALKDTLESIEPGHGSHDPFNVKHKVKLLMLELLVSSAEEAGDNAADLVARFSERVQAL